MQTTCDHFDTVLVLLKKQIIPIEIIKRHGITEAFFCVISELHTLQSETIKTIRYGGDIKIILALPWEFVGNVNIFCKQ